MNVGVVLIHLNLEFGVFQDFFIAAFLQDLLVVVQGIGILDGTGIIAFQPGIGI